MRKTIISFLLSVVSISVSAQELSFDNHLERAHSLYSRQKYREAIFEFGLARRDAADRQTLSEIDFYHAMSSARMGCDTLSLDRYLADYPDSKLRRAALFNLAAEYFEAASYSSAYATYSELNPSRLAAGDLDEYYFKSGYAAYQLGDLEHGRKNLLRIESSDSPYFEHALYALAYIDYLEGHYDYAERRFEGLRRSTEYGVAMPYMVLCMRFLQGDWNYVTTHGDEVLAGIEGSRRRELQRTIAESWFRRGGWVKAESYLSLYAKSGKLNREENYMAGYAMYRAASFDKAISYLRAASGPDDNLTQSAAYHLADCYLKKSDYQSAMQSFSMAYTSGDDEKIREDALYNYCKLEIGYGEGHFDEEMQSLRQYLTRYPQSTNRTEIEGYFIAACYTAKDLRNAYEALYEFRDFDDRIRAAIQQIAYRYSLQCYSAGDLATAEVYADRSLEYRTFDRGTEALATLRKGDIAYTRGNYAVARQYYEEYIAMRQRSQTEYQYAFYNLGYAKFNDSIFDDAFDDFADFTELHTTNDSFRADALNRMGDIEAAARAYDRAVACYRQCAALTDCDEHYYAAYRVAFMEGMAGRNDRRITALRAIIKEGKGDYFVRSNYELGNTLVTAGQYDEAAKVLENFIDIWPSSPYYIAALADLGLAYRNTGNDELALNSYKLVVDRARGSIAAKNALTEIMNIYVERGEVNTYFDYAVKVGASTDVGQSQRDSLTFVAAQKIYMSGDKKRAEGAFDDYLVDNPEGVYAAAALYYGSDCSVAVGDNEAALAKLTRLTGMYYNNYTRRAYERMASIGFASENYVASAEAYRKLSTMAETPRRRREALGEYLKAVVAGGDNNAIITAADEITASSDATDELLRKADFAKAKALLALGKQNPAVAIFNRLSADVSNPEGAESAYIIIETAYRYGSLSKAEELVFDFADRNTPHAYWLAKAFLCLGDIYLRNGDAFQARATYQSIVDGYAVQDDGIVDEAKERISNL